MELLNHMPGFLLGLIGWAATVLVLEGAARLSVNDRRAMIVCSWTLWMIPAFGTLVLRGLIATDVAALTVTFSTLALGLIMALGAFVRPRTRP